MKGAELVSKALFYSWWLDILTFTVAIIGRQDSWEHVLHAALPEGTSSLVRMPAKAFLSVWLIYFIIGFGSNAIIASLTYVPLAFSASRILKDLG